MKDLFDKCQFGNFELNSRVLRTGIWETQKEEGGFLSNEVFQKYEDIAKSGVGAIISEMLILDSRDRFNDYSVNINHKNFIKDYREINEIAHKYNVPVLGQLAFFFYNDGLNQKVEANDISLEGIRRLQAEIIMAVKKLSFAGFDGVQFNLGNNFYLARFINPYFNQRKDNYGGNTFNRLRIILEIIKIIKDNYDLHINCKINPIDVRKGGMTPEESLEICKLLEEYGADSIQITARTISYVGDKESHPFIDFASKLGDELNIPVVLGGTLRDSETINDILNKTNVDFVSMSKPFVAQADFLSEWKLNGRGTAICQSCNNCYSKKTSTCFKY
ncbi:MAG: tRNA-dihydrouridine synthase [archaeon]|nr:tRNA-dihydrouridine synthase [archaeon]